MAESSVGLKLPEVPDGKNLSCNNIVVKTSEFMATSPSSLSSESGISGPSGLHDLDSWDVLVGKVIGRWDHSSLKIQPIDASAHRFDEGAELCLEPHGGRRRTVKVLASRRQGKALICDVGISSQEEAEALRGSTIWIHPSMRPPLPEGEFYLDEILGFQVRTENGEELGTVDDVLETPAHNVYVTETAMIPAHREFIAETDWKSRVLIVRDIPGLKL